MTKATTRKTAAARRTGKTAAQEEAASKAPVSMDPAARETSTPEAPATTPRLCYAAKTLLSEVATLFPDATYVDGERNGRGVLIGLTFELASLTDDDAVTLVDLLMLLRDPAHSDERRIVDVTHDHDEQLLHVAFRNDPRFSDLREPFGLVDAYAVLGDPEAEAGLYVAEDDDPLLDGVSL